MMASPPKCFMAISKDTRVRKEGFWNIMPKVFPAQYWFVAAGAPLGFQAQRQIR